MKKYIKKFLKKSFVRNVMVMATGTAAAQLIKMLFYPFVTRIYGPEALGIMGAFSAIINIVTPVAALAYPIAIVLPKRDEDAKGIVRLSLIVTITITIISIIILILFHNQIVVIFNLDEIANYLFLLPLVIIFAGLMQVAEQWLIRVKQFSINAKVTFYQSLIINAAKVGVGYFYPRAAVLVVTTALSSGIRAFLMIIFAKRTYRSKTRERIKDKPIKDLAKKYYEFPIYRAPEMLLSAISFGFPVLLLTVFFGPAAAGFYSLGMSVLSAPTQLIGKSVGDVFYPRAAEAKNNNENLTSLIKRATFALSGIGIIPYTLIFLFGPTLFSLVFGSEWATAGEYARWIALYSFFNFINKPSIQSLPVLNAQKFHLIYTIIRTIVRIIVLVIGYYIFSSDIVAVILYGISGAILDFGLIIITLKISKKY